MLMLGPFLSILWSMTGPAVAQFPAASQTWRVPVAAAPASVPAGPAVGRANAESPGTASPTASVAVQELVMSLACQKPSGLAHTTAGAVVSRTTTSKKDSAAFPAPSSAVHRTCVRPRGNCDPEAGAHVAVPSPLTAS